MGVCFPAIEFWLLENVVPWVAIGALDCAIGVDGVVINRRIMMFYSLVELWLQVFVKSSFLWVSATVDSCRRV